MEQQLPILPSWEDLQKEEEARDHFLEKYKWLDVDIEENIFDVKLPFVKSKFTLAFKGVPFAPLGGIHSFTGQSGNGKTMTITQFIVAILKGEFGGLTYELAEELPNPKVLYIDTEMERVNTQYVNARVYSLLGWTFGEPHEEFKILMLREETEAVDRWRKTLKAIYELKPNIVFIDGLLDLTADFNNNSECAQLIYECMATASHYNISLWCVVHENPNGSKLVGHLGSMLERKVTDIFSTKKSKDQVTGDVTFEVSQKKARGKDIDNFLFRVVDGKHNLGEPQQIYTPDPPTPEEAEAKEKQEINEYFKKMDFRANGKSRTEIENDCKRLQLGGKQKLSNNLEKAKQYGIISQADNRRYYYHGLNASPEPEQAVMPFEPTTEQPPY